MENILLAFGGALLGIVATVIVGRYYFLRTVDKRLSAYIHLASPVLAGIDPSVRQVLKTYYRDVEVVDLFQLQFLVANEGERAIRDLIEPLTLELPMEVKLLDATVLHIHPKERVVGVSTKDKGNNGGKTTFIECTFPLLNKGDFFLVKLLLDGVLDYSNLEFRITVDDLPPIIKPSWLPFSIDSSKEPRIDWLAVLFGVFLLLVSLASAFATFLVFSARKELYFMFPFSQSSYAVVILVYSIIVLCGLGSLGLFLVALISIAGIGLEGILQRKPRFPLPTQLYSNRMPLFFHSLNIEEKED
jgi:hypothetical protein